MTPLEEVLAKARDSLIDKTLRNRHLNFKPTEKTHAQNTESPADELFPWLVTNEKGIG